MHCIILHCIECWILRQVKLFPLVTKPALLYFFNLHMMTDGMLPVTAYFFLNHACSCLKHADIAISTG